MANEHSIRVSARGEFGQLERGLKNLQKDLSSVLGEVDKGARRGGFFDETQLRALDLYRSRFKGTMGELNREFARQGSAIDELERKKEKSFMSERNRIDEEIKKREKNLDVLRRQIMAVEDLYKKRNKEASTYQTTPVPEPMGGGMPSSSRGGGILPGLGSKLLGAGKFALGLAGVGGIASMGMQAYQKAYDSQVSSMDLSQRLRGNAGYSGSAKGMWDTIGGIGRNNSMGYTSAESWQFQDQYSRSAGAMGERDLENSLMFGRAYGLDVGESSSALASANGSASSASEFANLVSGSVEKSGMTPRILEVMQTATGLLANMNTTLKDTGAKQILAYQTTLDTIGNEKGMKKLTGQSGADIISGLGGIYGPDQGNNWKYMGMQALQQYNPKKYGDMGLFDLEMSFEDGLMNGDNLPAMSKYLKEKSGGNENMEKRMLQRWLQDGGYNATKRQTEDLYSATDGLTAFDKDKMDKVTADLEKGDGTAKYQERMGQLGQDILDVNSRFDKQLENIGQPILAVVTEMKGGITSILEELNTSDLEKTVEDILGFLEDNWGLLATVAGVGLVTKAVEKLAPLLKPGGGGGKDTTPDKSSKLPTVIAGGGKLGMLALLLGGAVGGKQLLDVFSTGNKEKHQKIAEGAGLDPNDISGVDRWFAEMGEAMSLMDPEDFYKLFSKEKATEMKNKMDDFIGTLFPSWNVPQSKEQKKAVEELGDTGNKKMNWYEYANPSKWGDIKAPDIKIPESWGKNFEEMKKGFFDDFIVPVNEAMGWDLGGKKRDEAVNSLTTLGNTGQVNIQAMTATGTAKLQELADQGLIKMEEGKQVQTTLLSGFSEAGKAELTKMADEGLISIGGFTTDGKAKISVLSEEGQKRLTELKKNGTVDISEFKTESTKKITALNKKGSEELIKLQKNGSVSMDSMDKTTDKKLESVRKNTKTSLSDIEGEHKSWSEKLVGKDGIFPKWADSALGVFDSLFTWMKEKLPKWLGGDGGDSDVGQFINGGEGKALDKSTLSYKDELARAGSKYGIEDTDLLLAIMNQESHGKGNNPMQVNGVTDPDTSVEKGVAYFAKVLKKAGGDVELALQAYNMGEGYIDYANKRGGHSKKNAKAFSEYQLSKNPQWSVYGDPNYVDNVLQYYPKASAGGDFFKGWNKRVTSEYGEDRGSKNHGGLDINGEQGDALQALTGGKVEFLKFDDGSKRDSDGRKNTRGGGTELGIRMPNGEIYFYSHMSNVADGLKVGDTVKAGQFVGNVGGDPGKPGSGSSTNGSHLHLGYLNGKGNYKDPRLLLNSLLGGKGDSDIGSFASASQSINVTVKLTGDVDKLNAKTENTLRKLIKQTVKEIQQQKLLTNPSMR